MDLASKNRPGGIGDHHDPPTASRIQDLQQVFGVKTLLQRLHPEQEALFQKVKPKVTKDDQLWYENAPLGKKHPCPNDASTVQDVQALKGIHQPLCLSYYCSPSVCCRSYRSAYHGCNRPKKPYEPGKLQQDHLCSAKQHGSSVGWRFHNIFKCVKSY